MLQEIKCIPNETSDKENPYLTLLTVSNLEKVVFIIFNVSQLTQNNYGSGKMFVY